MMAPSTPLLLTLLLSVLVCVNADWLSSLLSSPKKAQAPPSNIPPPSNSNPNLTFLKWFTNNGGYVNPAITLSVFEMYGRGLKVLDGSLVSHLEVLFSAPSNIILTKSKIMDLYDDSTTKRGIDEVVNDDYAIALELCVQCALGPHSKWDAYLNVLPHHVSNLETFTAHELALLDSASLEKLGNQMQERTTRQYAAVSGLLKNMAEVSGQKAKIPKIGFEMTATRCLSFESFRHYTSIVASRAMVISGEKHLTPLADMPNYEPKNDGRVMANGQDFMKYHVLGDDGSMTVKSDRDFGSGQQVFEDYGDNPNSLYLEAHGFVPFSNPFDCAELPNPVITDEKVLNVMKKLKIVEGEQNYCPPVCVKADGEVETNTRSYAYYAVAALGKFPTKLKYCEVNMDDPAYAGSACIRWGGSGKAVNELISVAANEGIKNFGSSIDEDEKRVKTLEGNEALAVRYRLSKKRILSEVASSVGVVEEKAKVVSDDPTSLAEKVANFNAFIESLNFPTNYLTAYLAGAEQRVGTKASRKIVAGEPYITVPNVAVMSSDTAATDSSLVNELIARGKSMNDDFHTLLFFTMHERFVSKSKSKWWPYLTLLPTLQDYQEYHPNFFSDEKLEGLLGSPVRELILKNQGKIKRNFQGVSGDVAVLEAFGKAWTVENYSWAMTVLDSRSIWWSGMRHLVPLLDLINCQEGPAGSTVHATNLDSGGKNAVTLAPWSFKEGEQVFENYGQPNHIYFLFHGFVLQSNAHDCSLIMASVGPNDGGARDMDELKRRMEEGGFNSYSAEFCVNEKNVKEETENLMNFLSIKDGLTKVDASVGVEHVEAQLKKYPEVEPLADDAGFDEKCMRSLVEGEKKMLGLVLAELQGRKDEL
ncbi:hypothetical protein TL16_g08620 [Triparma laevis f. inornata]|uniref:SET domain-containing protein n=1 Tax=Triparma laevis f. inornata TaxID=1714386 RepID=A0A9W7EJ67_9STRA|nr:hypothetical protein TL16_g08620 [Triparma laevis f. inornata]